MLRYLRILAWLLLTFGIVGLVSALVGIDIGIGIGPSVAVLMAVQAVVGGLILGGLRWLKQGRLERRVLTSGAIILILFYIVAGQIWLNVAKPERGANATRAAEISAAVPPT